MFMLKLKILNLFFDIENGGLFFIRFNLNRKEVNIFLNVHNFFKLIQNFSLIDRIKRFLHRKKESIEI